MSKCGSASVLPTSRRPALPSRVSCCAAIRVIWAAGVRPSPLVDSLGAELGPGGSGQGAAGLLDPRPSNVFVIGDAAYLVDSKTGKQVPGVSQGALQMGKYVAAIIREEQAVATRL